MKGTAIFLMLQSNTPEWSCKSGQLSTQTADQLTMAASTHAIANWLLLTTMD